MVVRIYASEQGGGARRGAGDERFERGDREDGGAREEGEPALVEGPLVPECQICRRHGRSAIWAVINTRIVKGGYEPWRRGLVLPGGHLPQPERPRSKEPCRICTRDGKSSPRAPALLKTVCLLRRTLIIIIALIAPLKAACELTARPGKVSLLPCRLRLPCPSSFVRRPLP